MGVLIVVEKPPATSPYDYWKLERATTKTGSYTNVIAGNGQAITDLTYYDTAGTSSHWYKIRYYDSSGDTHSAYSDPMQGLSETYTTVRKVENFLQLQTTLTDSTKPTVQQVVELINRVEDEIDQRTGHAWRLRYSETQTALDMTAKYEYHDISEAYEYQSGIPIYLKHRQIRTLDTDEGDVIQIWDGESWYDWTTNYTEGRGEDYWLDYTNGILFLKTRYGIRKPLGLRIKYRYGETVVNKIVEDIATKMVAIDILLNETNMTIIPEGSSAMTIQQRIEIMRQQIEEKLQSIKEFQIPAIS